MAFMHDRQPEPTRRVTKKTSGAPGGTDLLKAALNNPAVIGALGDALAKSVAAANARFDAQITAMTARLDQVVERVEEQRLGPVRVPEPSAAMEQAAYYEAKAVEAGADRDLAAAYRTLASEALRGERTRDARS